MKTFSSIIVGVILIILGVIFGLNALEITSVDLFFDGWWTLIIIIPSVIGLIKDNDKTGSMIGIVIGVLLLIACQDIISFELVWKLTIPMILIIIGLSMILKDTLNSKIRKKIKTINSSDKKSYCATFSSQKINIDEEKFYGSQVDAVFGEVKLDLRKAIIKEDVVITISTIFGGVDVFVPDNINVKISSTSIFGGVDNKHKNIKNDNEKTIYINATNIFGGVDVK